MALARCDARFDIQKGSNSRDNDTNE